MPEVGLARTSRFAVAKLGLGTASRPQKLLRHRSGVRVSTYRAKARYFRQKITSYFMQYS